MKTLGALIILITVSTFSLAHAEDNMVSLQTPTGETVQIDVFSLRSQLGEFQMNNAVPHFKDVLNLPDGSYLFLGVSFLIGTHYFPLSNRAINAEQFCRRLESERDLRHEDQLISRDMVNTPEDWDTLGLSDVVQSYASELQGKRALTFVDHGRRNGLKMEFEFHHYYFQSIGCLNVPAETPLPEAPSENTLVEINDSSENVVQVELRLLRQALAEFKPQLLDQASLNYEDKEEMSDGTVLYKRVSHGKLPIVNDTNSAIGFCKRLGHRGLASPREYESLDRHTLWNIHDPAEQEKWPEIDRPYLIKLEKVHSVRLRSRDGHIKELEHVKGWFHKNIHCQ